MADEKKIATIEEIAAKTLPLLIEGLEKNEDFLNKARKGLVPQEDVDAIKAENVAMQAELKSIQEALANRKDPRLNPEDDGKFGFKSLQEFLTTKMLDDDKKEADKDPRLVEFKTYEKTVEDTARNKGINITNALFRAGTGPVASDNTYGGGLIPPAFGGILIDEAMENTGLINMMTGVPMAVPSIEWSVPANWDHSSGTYYGGVYVSSTEEIGTIAEVRPQFDKVKLSLEAVKIISAPSNKMITFSPVSVEAMLKEMMTNSLSMWMVDKFINGKGSGEPLGVLSLTDGEQGIAVAGNSGQTTDTIILDNVLNMKKQCYRNAKPTLRWIANYDTEPQLRKLHLTIGTGGVPVYAFAAGNQQFDTLFNIPVMYTEFAQTLGDAGDIMLVDPAAYFRGYLSMSPTFDTSSHVYFVYDQTAIKLVFYCDMRPKWTNVMTPRYSAVTMSPYVRLASR